MVDSVGMGLDLRLKGLPHCFIFAYWNGIRSCGVGSNEWTSSSMKAVTNCWMLKLSTWALQARRHSPLGSNLICPV